MYQAEGFPGDFYTVSRVDLFWGKIFQLKDQSGIMLKYGLLKKVVCSLLTIQHGNAECERSLSDNKNTLSPDRVGLGPNTLMGLRRMKEHARSVGGAHMVHTTSKEMLKVVRLSHQTYLKRKEQEAAEARQQRLTAELNQQEDQEIQDSMDKEAERNKRLDEREKTLMEQEKKTSREQEVAQKLLDEATRSLNEAIEKSDLVRAQVARDMLNTARNNLKKAIKQKEENLKLRQKFSAKRKNAFEKLMESAKKKKV